jgi:hypothetical protein
VLAMTPSQPASVIQWHRRVAVSFWPRLCKT